MKKLFFLIPAILCFQLNYATIHIIGVWSGYYQFVPSNITIQLGDTIQWHPLFDLPSLTDPHTITSTTIPGGAPSFDVPFASPSDTFFQYIPQVAGIYNYVCTPHAISMGMTGSFEVIDSTAGIYDEILLSLKVFPNPSSSYINLSINSDNYTVFKSSNNTIELTSTEGKLVKKMILPNMKDEHIETKMDISELAGGIYFLKISSGKLVKQVKVIIQH